jgi:transketolase
MSESNTQKNTKTHGNVMKEKTRVLSENFYGALKSKNEIYFQMASLFKEVTRDEKKLKNQWMKKFLLANPLDSHGICDINNI